MEAAAASASVAMAASSSSSATASQSRAASQCCKATGSSPRHNRQHPRKQGFGGSSSSRCGAHPGDSDFFFDAALAATAAAAAVLPMYWFYVHSSSAASKSRDNRQEFREFGSSSGIGSEDFRQFDTAVAVLEQRGGLEIEVEHGKLQAPTAFTSREFQEISSPAQNSSTSRDDLAQVAEFSPIRLLESDERHTPELPAKEETVLEQAVKKFTRMPSPRGQEDLIAYDRLIRARRIRESLEVLEEMEKKGTLDMNKVYHARFYQECKRQLAVEEAFRYTGLIKSPTLSTYNMLLSVCCNARDTNGAFGAFAALKRAGFKPDCMIYTTLISTCSKALKTDLVFQVYREMESVGVEANLLTYGAIIDGCARTGELAKAFGIYRIMLSKKIKPDRVIFNSLINACGRSGAVKRAFEVFTELKSESLINPNHVTMCSLIDACSKAGDGDSAYEVYTMMRKRGIGGCPEPYTAAVHACSSSGNLERAFSIYDDMKKDGVKADEIFFSALIDVAGHAGKINCAFDVLQEVEKYSLVPGPVIFSSLMGVCSNTGNWEKAIFLYENIQAVGIRPSVSTLNALMTALCRGKQFQNALQSLEELKEAGVSPNQLTYSILLEACEKENEAGIALNLYTHAIADGIVPNLAMCDNIIGICLEGIQSSIGPPKLASSVNPLWMVDDNQKPHGQWLSWALACFRQTLSGGAQPTLPVLSRLLACLRIPESSERADTGLVFQTSSPNKHLVEGFGVYDPRASALYEEASSIGVVPAFKCDGEPIVFEADGLPIYTAEVCLLTILKALRRRCAAGAELPFVIIKFETTRKSVILPDGRVKAITVTRRNGQALAALLRKLKLRFNGKESLGKIRLHPVALSQWFKPSAATPSPSSPAKARVDHANLGVLPRPLMLGKSIAEQQRAIRMGTPLPSERRQGSSLNHRFRKISPNQE
ncbi:pentatricopeptide repeat-containing protein MRL1, chloroplastic [Selaginella moellendorffii]|uniref:pentatricopeptide repeat-containing protein MRL1, chloroplastic n=1 Tax=Selaginella moellendorffii TaxID=88036 RepID=UPI000D1C9659|nr:pentatricopeptide repeat-containing protein MRL1, chloroplastic [Selaginella moellendorffii]XP_024542519.1 pentatricopeptide repeat-containing protein MRL1, chloroplastic [Selaginella moellendorffii]XP_024542520.1 pentatricopeptide repeat-containing protein MRL1, chloroplastic [Selaginella moellendorffii]XP_024542521.1 pentatricopeptide repeat-containing protein MRL1, chloroplastic [Selaginella moellendorffii]XP_024542522.1 pentatricopeptide repeat-containing protein MRL1, chloroplastic [Sel|eukprot:XP_024542518.1 pentatricopeptide repeat-containing protein MRL1, chloroplastic [Selaginella moellendorffii]